MNLRISMTFSKNRAALLAAATLLAACSGNSTIPAAQSDASSLVRSMALQDQAPPPDTTSILKKLKKDVVIGSTVDPSNGDTGPYSVSTVQFTYGGLKKGQLVVCNFADKTGTAGKGTTIELLDAKPGSKPATFTNSNHITGCDGVATSQANYVYGGGLNSGQVAGFTPSGKFSQEYGKPIVAPFSDADVRCTALTNCLYSAEYIFVSDAQTGGLVNFSINHMGHYGILQVVKGFAVNNKPGWKALGPSGLAYNYPANTIYVADGVDNTIVGITNASNLFVKDEVVVKPGGKTFKCKYDTNQAPCGKLVKAGSPLNVPVAMTGLPNGNLIAANTHGGSTLVELTPTGKVLDTKVIDAGKKPVVFGLAATGTNDKNTVVFYTDTKDNTVHELEP